MLGTAFISTVFRKRRERQSSQHIWWLDQKPGPEFQKLPFPDSGTGPPTHPGREALTSGPRPGRPLLPEAHRFPSRPCPGPLPQRQGRGGTAARTRFPPAAFAHPIADPAQPFRDPDLSRPFAPRLSLRCDLQTCRQTPDRVCKADSTFEK
uniref:Uncharacterized protein n=1 Tax=Pipistrellus kuhlii TaxID=59472 RepID=A0A7J7QWJ3_PIPKU|nr:hypothetical protein mPipKuh1_008234 [Pipistrellus kuhlii]